MAKGNNTVVRDGDDNSLIALAKGGDNSALTCLLCRYAPMVSKKSCSFNSLIGLDTDDLYQEGMLGLMSAVYSFEQERGASFSTYADLLVTRKMLSAIRSADSQKNLPLREYVPIDEESGLYSALPTPEEALIHSEELKNIKEFINTGLSKTEKKVLKLTLLGLSYSEISEILECGEKSVDNALQRIRRKFRDFKK